MALPPEGATIIRQSTINEFQLCPARVGYKGAEGYLAPLGEPLTVGDSLHYMTSRHMAGDSPNDIMGTFDEWLEGKLCNEYQWSSKLIPNYGDLKKEIFDCYRLWIFQIYQPSLSLESSVYMEQILYMCLSEAENLWLQGTPDLGILSKRLLDWKTAKSDRQWSQARADLSIQASLYLALHNAVFQEQLTKFTFAVYNRAKAEWGTFDTTRVETEQIAALYTATQYARQMKAMVFPATPVSESYGKKQRGWHCSAKWCGAWNICEAKFLNDNVDETVVAIREWR